MKPYGNTRVQNGHCKFGCCTLGTVKTNHNTFVAKAHVRAARKRARRDGKLVVNEE